MKEFNYLDEGSNNETRNATSDLAQYKKTNTLLSEINCAYKEVSGNEMFCAILVQDSEC